jgi:poly(3-hydroxyalkanoate) depolymerase
MAEARAAEIGVQRIDGRELRVAHWRAKRKDGRPPLLFFNGIGANIELIAPLAGWMPERDILTFDMPGVGGSPEPTIPYRAWMMARAAAKLLDATGYETADVMGVSWGGAMAQQFAFQYPARTGRLVLAATSAGMLMVPGKVSSLAKMADPRRYTDPDFMRRNFQSLYGGNADGSDSHVSRIAPPSRRGYFYQLIAMLGWTSAPFLPFLKAETLVLMGDDDQVVPLVNGRILASLIPNARLHIIKGGGHLFLVSQAAQTIPAVQTFLDERRAPKRRAA